MPLFSVMGVLFKFSICRGFCSYVSPDSVMICISAGGGTLGANDTIDAVRSYISSGMNCNTCLSFMLSVFGPINTVRQLFPEPRNSILWFAPIVSRY